MPLPKVACARALGLTHADIDDVLDYLCAVAAHREIYFLWRPVLHDASDDMLLEVAVEAECDFVVTHDVPIVRGRSGSA